MRAHPHVYEINALVMLNRLSESHGLRLTLATVPQEEWLSIARRGFDFVWLMGVWRRSPAGRRVALLEPNLRRQYGNALPDWTDKDVAGSPYAIHDYALDPSLGKAGELAELKSTLNRLGLSLILDFVPNHLALDHRWTRAHPDWFVQGSAEDARSRPGWFFSRDEGVHIAHGKDPYFPPWTDTAQVNFFSPDMREAMTRQLLKIAEIADGVRCDMAMLGLNSVFERVWGWALPDRPRPAAEFWSDAIGKAKAARPGFVFMAEAYWGLERELQQLGFDFTYDKDFYERLRSAGPAEIQGYLATGAKSYQGRSARFIENHDEPRAAQAFGRERSLAAAVALATVPGLRLFHDGQLEGKHVRLPVQLAREPKESPDPDLVRFYERLLTACDAPVFHDGEWTAMVAHEAWAGNLGHRSLLSWLWRLGGSFKIVAVNYSPERAQGRLRLPLPLSDREHVDLRDELTSDTYTRDLAELRSSGLFVDLGPWGAHLLDMTLDI